VQKLSSFEEQPKTRCEFKANIYNFNAAWSGKFSSITEFKWYEILQTTNVTLPFSLPVNFDCFKEHENYV